MATGEEDVSPVLAVAKAEKDSPVLTRAVSERISKLNSQQLKSFAFLVIDISLDARLAEGDELRMPRHECPDSREYSRCRQRLEDHTAVAEGHP